MQGRLAKQLRQYALRLMRRLKDARGIAHARRLAAVLRLAMMLSRHFAAEPVSRSRPA